jgi:hypothetical protein
MPRWLLGFSVIASSCIVIAQSQAQLLHPPVLTRLPTGATKPNGWLKDELLLQAEGMTGQLPKFWHYLNHSDWMGSSKDPYGREGGAPRQFLPYYLNGLLPLSYQVDDDNLAALREKYMGYILGAQNASGSPAQGWLGPALSNPLEYMTKYDAVQAIEAYAEAEPTKKAMIVGALIAHHRQFWAQAKANTPNFNQSKWGISRYSDAIVGIQWLIDNSKPPSSSNGAATEDTSFLFDLMRFIRDRSDAVMGSVSEADGGGFTWEAWFEKGDPFTKVGASHGRRSFTWRGGSPSPSPLFLLLIHLPFLIPIPPSSQANDGEKTKSVHLRRHGVDIGEAMKTGALWWRVDGLENDRTNSYMALQWGEKYLHMSDGMYFADEEVTYGGGNTSINGGHNAGRGTETCSVVEQMESMRVAYEITGNITFMDRLERIAFNSLPAALWPDVTANVYHHSSNQLSCGASGCYIDVLCWDCQFSRALIILSTTAALPTFTRRAIWLCSPLLLHCQFSSGLLTTNSTQSLPNSCYPFMLSAHAIYSSAAHLGLAKVRILGCTDALQPHRK